VAMADGMCCMLELMHRLFSIFGPQSEPKSQLDPLFANYTLLRVTDADYFGYIMLGHHLLGLAAIALLYFSTEYLRPLMMCPYFAMEIFDIIGLVLLIAYNVGLLIRHGKLQIWFGVGYSICFLLALLLELYFFYVTYSCFSWMRETKPQRPQEHVSGNELGAIPSVSRCVPQFQEESNDVSQNVAGRSSGISSFENPAFIPSEADDQDEDIVFDRKSIVEPSNIALKKRSVRFKNNSDSE